jgi:hypothetical protein
MNIDEKLTKRADGLRDWLAQNHPECRTEQAHLNEGTPERAYWHFGYLMAIRDILDLAGRTITEMRQVNDHRLGRYN